MSHEDRTLWILHRVEELTGRAPSAPPRIFDDTTSFMYIDRDDIIELAGELFLVRGHEKEGRFGLDEQPKFWVKRSIALDGGDRCILKLSCKEAFKVRIGKMEIICARDSKKEARVLELVRGDARFMQGRSTPDIRGNLVRIIDFIDGEKLIDYIDGLDIPHRRYVDEKLPEILGKTFDAFRAIQFLTDHGFCHGDIRNDHIIVERSTGRFRWIDFDLTQDIHDYDLWSLGNILHFVAAKGFVSFRELPEQRPDVSERLTSEDASVFFPYRVMNLGKVFPYLPSKLSAVLRRFSVGASAYYGHINEVVDELGDCIFSLGPSAVEPGAPPVKLASRH